MFIFVVGCLDYKAYNAPEDDVSEDSLINEIAEIERELGFTDEEDVNGEIPDDTDPVVEEDVILPDLEDEELFSEEPQVITIKENELVKLNVQVSDPDEDEVSYSFGKPLDRNGEWQTNYGDAGEYLVTITATDQVLTTEKNVKIVVERVNVPPIISAMIDITVQEGETVEFEPTVTDPNNDPVTLQVSDPLQDGFFDTDHTSAGEYQIRVTASDGELASDDSFLLTVLDVNVLPEIFNVEDITVEEGETVLITPEITDLDEDEITLTITEPVGNDGVWETAFTDHGEYVITITADDGKDTVRMKVNVVVEDVNMPPEILDVTLVVS